MRNKLINVLIQANEECEMCEKLQPYPCDGCKYQTFDRRIHGCIFEKFADAIIESDLLKDDKVYEPKLNCIDYGLKRYECSNCGREVTGCNYCPQCGVRVKEVKIKELQDND